MDIFLINIFFFILFFFFYHNGQICHNCHCYCYHLILRPTDQLTDRPSDRPTDRNIDWPIDRPIDRPSDRLAYVCTESGVPDIAAITPNADRNHLTRIWPSEQALSTDESHPASQAELLIPRSNQLPGSARPASYHISSRWWSSISQGRMGLHRNFIDKSPIRTNSTISQAPVGRLDSYPLVYVCFRWRSSSPLPNFWQPTTYHWME